MSESVTAAAVIARHRCEDVHGVRWDVPTALRDVMTPCAACTSWGEHVARHVVLMPPKPAPADGSGLRDAVRATVTEALRRRTYWAHQPGVVSVARAIAYQSIASLLIQALDAEDRRG